jgi:pyruvate dehydrogenase E1 component
MPEFWQFPTVSMGLGPLMAIYQARFLKYLHGRGLADTERRKVWAFMGDGEMDEPESLGAISLAGRELLDNLIFVINCNLQRLDGPVRGNGKIVQELEGIFRGAGWNVIKVLWGSGWDGLLAKDTSGLLRKRMEECVDGEYQDFKSKNGAMCVSSSSAKYPETAALVKDWSDDDIWRSAAARSGQGLCRLCRRREACRPATVILAKTVKGYGMGEPAKARTSPTSRRRWDSRRCASSAIVSPFRCRTKLEEIPLLTLADDSPEMKYLRERRAQLGGSLPQRRRSSNSLDVPELSVFKAQLASTEDREISTTMAFVRILNTLLRDKAVGRFVVPIVPDESRTFGMEGMFRQLGIFSQVGQLYKPQDADHLMYYREDKSGPMLQEGINEAGAMSSWIAAATCYSASNVPMISFYIYYSMFGLQRVGDLAWAAGDMRCRGFLLGGTAGRTTLSGEGLQHEDGHSHLLAATIPNCVAYDPTFAYEVAVIIADGLRRMLKDQEDVYFYITLMNENYPHPAMPDGAEEGIRRGMYLLREGNRQNVPRVQLLGSGTILREVIAAAGLLADEFGVVADLWGVPSFNELRREAIDVERWNMLHPTEAPRAELRGRMPGQARRAGCRGNRLYARVP